MVLIRLATPVNIEYRTPMTFFRYGDLMMLLLRINGQYAILSLVDADPLARCILKIGRPLPEELGCLTMGWIFRLGDVNGRNDQHWGTSASTSWTLNRQKGLENLLQPGSPMPFCVHFSNAPSSNGPLVSGI